MDARTRTTTCEILRLRFDEVNERMLFELESEYGHYYANLWYPCPTKKSYRLLRADLAQCTYWKFRYYPDTGQIIKMQGISDGCTVQ